MNESNDQPRVDSIEGDATGGVIPYKNVPALVAYYLGVFSLIPWASRRCSAAYSG